MSHTTMPQTSANDVLKRRKAVKRALRSRERKRSGLVPVQVDLFAREINRLVSLGHLDVGDREDRDQIAGALQLFLDEALADG